MRAACFWVESCLPLVVARKGAPQVSSVLGQAQDAESRIASRMIHAEPFTERKSA